MELFDTLIKNGTCLIKTPSGTKEELVDLGIKEGKISKIGSFSSSKAGEVFDAKNLHVLPGLIDSQVHFREPGLEHKDDIRHGTFSAVKGGITGIFEMPNTTPPTTNEENFQQKINIAEENSYCEYGFFLGASFDNLEVIKKAHEIEGCCGVKIFMGSSTGTLLVSEDENIEKILSHAKVPIAVHSEDEERLKERAHLAKKGDVKTHPLVRDEICALRSTKRLVHIAEKTQKKVHILHLTTREEMEFLKNKKEIATGEVTPQHLLLDSPSCYEKWGTLVQMNPPIRDISHQEALWKGLEEGTIDVIGSDHAPHTLEEKEKTYPETPSGIPGVQTTLPLMLNFVSQKRLSLKKLVEMMAEAPFRIYKVQNKGQIQEGFDADLTFVDLKRKQTIEKDWISYKCGWSPYVGKKITGWPFATFIRGQFVMKDGEVLGKPQGKAFSFKR